MILPEKIGTVTIKDDIPQEILKNALEETRNG
jgi:hypothetical protein